MNDAATKAREIADEVFGTGHVVPAPDSPETRIALARVYADLAIAEAISDAAGDIESGLDRLADKIMDVGGELRALESLSEAVGKINPMSFRP